MSTLDPTQIITMENLLKAVGLLIVAAFLVTVYRALPKAIVGVLGGIIGYLLGSIAAF